MKRILVLLLVVFATTLLFTQNNLQDVVYLKNGSVIRGVIIEQILNKSIKIETADRSVFVYQMDEIEKMTKEQRLVNRAHNSSGLKRGYRGIVELGYGISADDNPVDFAKLNIINGYQFNPYFSLGLGTGVRYYYDSYSELTMVPVFADFRVNFINRKVSPYISAGVGYSFNATDDFAGAGMYFDSTLGVRFMVSKKSALNIGFGYELQQQDFVAGTINMESISINVGISF